MIDLEPHTCLNEFVQVGLQHIADTVVEDANGKGISGGQVGILSLLPCASFFLKYLERQLHLEGIKQRIVEDLQAARKT